MTHRLPAQDFKQTTVVSLEAYRQRRLYPSDDDVPPPSPGSLAAWPSVTKSRIDAIALRHRAAAS